MPDHQRTLWCYGASLMAGDTIVDGEERNTPFSGFFNEMAPSAGMPKDRITAIARGISGEVTQQILDRLKGEAPVKPGDFLAVLGGTNDLRARLWETSRRW